MHHLLPLSYKPYHMAFSVLTGMYSSRDSQNRMSGPERDIGWILPSGMEQLQLPLTTYGTYVTYVVHISYPHNIP